VSPPLSSSLLVRISTSHAKSPSTQSSVGRFPTSFATSPPYPRFQARTVLLVFTVGAHLVGLVAAYIVGLSKTGLPGAAVLAVPLFATVFDGRLITGAALPVLMVADLFALSWYHQHARWDLLRPMAPWVGLGYAFGITFFIIVGTATRTLEIVIGTIVLSMVLVQAWRMWRGAPTRAATTGTAATYGSTGGFTTFVANAAGPVLNTYMIAVGLPKAQMVGTSAWMYFVVNATKIPFYLALGEWSSGGRFVTGDSLLYAVLMVPAIIAGVYSGRALFQKIPQREFLLAVLVLSAAGSIKLLV
jgi:uncharacterized membrane protein YfcA